MRHAYIIVILAAVCILTALIDVAVGSVSIPFRDILSSIVSSRSQSAADTIITLRLTRCAAAIMIGGSLAAAGAVMQTHFHNPIAGPYVLGISSGASLGVALAMIATTAITTLLGAGSTLASILSSAPLAAMIGAGVMTAAIAAASLRSHSSTTVLLLGLMLSYAISALVAILQSIADPGSLRLFTNWTLGSLSSITRSDLIIILSMIIVPTIAIASQCRTLDALLMGDEYAATLGVDLRRSRIICLSASSILTAAAVAFAGPICFIGTAAPHLARCLLRTSLHRWVIPSAIIIGMTMLLICDAVSRLPIFGIVLPINTLAALIAAPAISHIIIKDRRKW